MRVCIVCICIAQGAHTHIHRHPKLSACVHFDNFPDTHTHAHTHRFHIVFPKYLSQLKKMAIRKLLIPGTNTVPPDPPVTDFPGEEEETKA